MSPITLSTLSGFPKQLEAHYSAIPAEFRSWAPTSWEGVPSEPFTALGQLCQVRDIETDGYQVRIHRALQESNPLLDSIDSDALALERSYDSEDAEAALASFREARAKTVAVIANLNASEFACPALFEGYGPVTIRGMVHFL